MNALKPIVLIIDDEQAILDSLSPMLVDEGFVVQTLLGGKDALSVISKLCPDVILLDIFMPHCDGLELLQKIKQEYPGPKVIIISGFGTVPLAIDAIRKGADEFIEKPFSIEEVISKILAVTAPPASQASSASPLAGSAEIVGKSYLFLELLSQVVALGRLPFPLLISGERGTGKTLFSRYAHEVSDQQAKSYTLYDERAGFSFDCVQASLRKPGTVVIKNIDLLGAEAQSKLLAELEGPHLQARPMALTSKSLFKLTMQGQFNADLYAFFNVTPLELPPLHKRRIDVPLLAQYFLASTCEQQKITCQLSTPALRALTNHVWPKNCHSLAQVVETAVMCAHDGGSEVITEELIKRVLSKEPDELIDPQYFTAYPSLDEATQSFQKKFLLYHLKKNRYDLDQVSSILNVALPDLQSTLTRLNINITVG